MIYLLRHGQTEYNREGRIQGRCDSPLTDEGRQQMRTMGALLRELLAGQGEYEIIASPQSRARNSAQIVREEAGIAGPVITDERLQEVGCGSWERHHFASICERDPLVAETPCFLSAWAHYCSDGEGLDEATERLWSWLCWAGSRNLVVVSHGVAGSILRTLYIGGGKADMLTCHSAAHDSLYRCDRGWAEPISVS